MPRLNMPDVFGPITRIPVSAAIRLNSASNAAPSGPDSRKPLASTIAPATPAAAQSPSTPGTVRAGVAISATSTGAGTSAIVRATGRPRIDPPFGFTGCRG